MKIITIAKKILLISIKIFIVKSFLDVIVQWVFVDMEVREHIWGRFSRSVGYIFYDFILHFWFYILVCVCFYIILKRLKKSLIVYILSGFLVLIVCMEIHNYEFPFEQYYFPSHTGLNYDLIKDVLVYLLTLISMFYLMRHLNVKKNKH